MTNTELAIIRQTIGTLKLDLEVARAEYEEAKADPNEVISGKGSRKRTMEAQLEALEDLADRLGVYHHA